MSGAVGLGLTVKLVGGDGVEEWLQDLPRAVTAFQRRVPEHVPVAHHVLHVLYKDKTWGFLRSAIRSSG